MNKEEHNAVPDSVLTKESDHVRTTVVPCSYQAQLKLPIKFVQIRVIRGHCSLLFRLFTKTSSEIIVIQ